MSRFDKNLKLKKLDWSDIALERELQSRLKNQLNNKYKYSSALANKSNSPTPLGKITAADAIAPDPVAEMKANRDRILRAAEFNDILDIANRYNVSFDVAKALNTRSAEASTVDIDFFDNGNLEDGYQFGDFIGGILSTAADFTTSAVKGVGKIGEGVTDLILYGGAGVSSLFGYEEGADKLKGLAQENSVDEFFAPTDEWLDQYSYLGRTSQAIGEGVGQVGGVLLTGGAAGAAGLGAAGTTAVTTGLMGVSGAGSGMSEAYQNGATDTEAVAYGITAGLIDAGTELIFGGLGKGVNALGASKGLSSLDDMVAKAVTSSMKNQTVKNAVQFAIKSAAEGTEEVLAGLGQGIAKKLTYKSDEEIGKILSDENLLEQFIVGSLTSGIAQSGAIPGTRKGSLIESNKRGVDFIQEDTSKILSDTEQKVVDREVENRIAEKEKSGTKLTKRQKTAIEEQVIKDMDKGYISIGTIEEALGGDDYTSYKDAFDNEDALIKEYDELTGTKESEFTVGQRDRLNEIKELIGDAKKRTKSNEFKSKLGENVFSLVKGSRLTESYNENARRGKHFEADLSKYEEKYRPTIQKAVESGILNDTNRTHDFVDMLAKISADKGVLFDFANNEKLKNSGFAIDGKIVNGFKNKDGITVNIQSAKALDTVVGHEITHVLEGTDFYNELQTAVFELAKTKGEYDTRLADLEKLYADVKGADVKAELTADLVGDYLFTDADFVNSLSTKNRNLFQKVYDEIKYLCKVVTAGSKEARQLEKVRHTFEQAYKANQGKQEYTPQFADIMDDADTSTDTTFSLTGTDENGIEVYETSDATKALSYAERKTKLLDLMKNEYAGRTAKFTKNGEAYYALYNEDGVRKGIYGDNKSSKRGYKTKLNIGADGNYIELAENALYDHTSVEQGKSNDFHSDAKQWDYYLKTIKSDGRYYNVLINVKDTGNNHFVYDITIKETASLPRALPLYDGSSTASNKKIAQNGEKVNENSENDNVQYSVSVKDPKTIDFLENQEHIVTYKAMQVVDGKLYPPMAGKVKGEDGKYHWTNPSELGVWQQATEDPTNIKKFKKGVGYYTLNKGDGTSVDAAYNPYEHSSNLVLNDQFESAYRRDNLVTVECIIPVSEMSSGYKAEYAKDGTGVMDWKSGVVAGQIKDNKRQVYLSRYLKPVRILSEAETATKYKEVLDGTGVSVPFNVVSPTLLAELEKAGVSIDYDGSPNYKYHQARREAKKAKEATKYSVSDSNGKKLTQGQIEYFKDSKMRDDNGSLKVMYHGTQNGGFHEFNSQHSDDNTSLFFVDRADVAGSYSGTSETYAAKTFNTADDFNKFFAEINADEYSVTEQDGKFLLLDDGDVVGDSNTAYGLYEVFRDYSGLGYGEVNYEVYLNLKNPLTVNADGKNWYELPSIDKNGEVYSYIKVVDTGDSMGDITLEFAKSTDVAPTTEKVDLYNDDRFHFGIVEQIADLGVGESIENVPVSPVTTRDYAAYAKEQGYDGVIFNNVVDNGAYGGTNAASTVAIAFDSNQIKSVANENPTADTDIRFSLSKPVEETKDLIAVHNLQGEQLIKSLELGGLPMPSIAVIKAKDGHTEYGDVSLILNKNAIDPKADRNNKLYGGDAWTPVYPTIEYKANDKVVSNISKKFYELERKYGRNLADPLYNFAYDAERKIQNLKGEQGIIADLRNDDDMMRVFLADTEGRTIPTVTKEIKTTLSEGTKEQYDYMLDKLGAKVFNDFTNNGDSIFTHRRNMWEKHGESIKEAYRSFFADNFQFTTEGLDNVTQNMKMSDWFKEINGIRSYLKNGDTTTRTETDRQASKQSVIEAVDTAKYEQWLNSLFGGIEEKSGIRNNKDYFTPSGNRRSFEALHYENTLENVVRVMREGINGDTLFGGQGIWGVTAKEYSSIDEMKADADRLTRIPKEEYSEKRAEFTDRLFTLSDKLADKSERNQLIAHDNAAENIVDALRNSKNANDVYRYLHQYSDKATMQIAEDVVQLATDISNMPTEYFEAKPRRAVGFDEVAAFVIPYDADVKLKQELLNRGYNIAEYDPKVEGDRQRVVNSFEEYKFSLSNAGDTPSKYGNVFGKDIALESALTEETAPTVETAPVQTDTAQKQNNVDTFNDDFAPASLEDVEAEAADSFASLDESYAPIETETEYDEIPDTTSLNKKTLDGIVKTVKEMLYLKPRQTSAVREIVQKYSTSEMPSKADLFEELKSKFGEIEYTERLDDVAEVKSFLRDYRINVSQEIRNDIPDYRKWKNSNFGKIRFSKEGLPVDIAYMELQSEFPNFFPDDIDVPSDQLLRIAEVANLPVNADNTFELNDNEIQQVANLISSEITKYKQGELQKLVERDRKQFINQGVRKLDDIAPVIETEQPKAQINDAPIREDVAEQSDIAGLENTVEPKETKLTRSEFHKGKIDEMKAIFSNNDLDFDEVLKNAKDLKTFATVDNTPQRVMEKALGYKAGQVLSDITVNKVAQNETEGIKWLNSFTDRKNGLLKQISSKYDIKAGSKESSAAQMYAEGFYVNGNNELVEYGDAELAQDFPDATVRENIKGLAKDPVIRQIYDETLNMINESRKRNLYPEIPRLDNYFLHFRAMDDTFSRLGLPFNPNDIRAKDLPTDLNGVTADLKPGQPYFASAMHRTGKRTSFDLLGGLERYLTSAKNQIYHIDDIQNLRALRNYIADTYGQANGLESIDNLPEDEAQARIEQVYNSHLSTFAKFLNEEANVIAGKTALIDRGLEGIIGRRGITFLDTVNRQVGSNMVGFNISSALTNFIPVAQTFAKTNKADFVKAFGQTTANKIGSIFNRGDSFAENSPVVIRRKGADRFYRTAWQKAGDAGYSFMGAVDNISTELIARTKYNELTRKGMDSQTAHYETDKWVSRLMGDRSLGQMPQLYNSKMLGLITKFQLEVRNQLDSQFYDTIQETKVSNEHIENSLLKNAKTAAKVTSTFVQLAVAQHLFGKAFEAVAGYNPAFDIISAIAKAFGWDDEEDSEDTALDNIEQGFFELLEDLPYTSTLTGGRIPIESALPLTDLIKGEDKYGNEKSRWETLGEVAPYYVLPTGYGQIKKTVGGLKMFDDDLPIAGSYTDSGKLRFPVDDTFGNRLQAGVFGQWANSNARDYFNGERSALDEKQTQEFIDVGMSIQDYWKYRDGLKGLKTAEEKFDYVDSLDITTAQKNVLINNLVNRKESVDMTDYGQYPSLEEFDFANNNPDKYEFFQSNDISYDQYDYSEDTKNAYNWAFKNQDKYALSKVIESDFLEYYRQKGEMDDIEADKDENGNSISGSKKDKVINYINGLDKDYGEKIILFKSRYPKDDTYNYDIVEYLNGRSDISYEQEVSILEELGFTVLSDGTVTWE